MEVSEEAEGKEVEEKDEECKEEKGEVLKEEFVETMQRKDRKFFTAERKDEEVEKKGRKSDRRRRARQALGKSGRWLFLLWWWGRIGFVSMLQQNDCRKRRS